MEDSISDISTDLCFPITFRKHQARPHAWLVSHNVGYSQSRRTFVEFCASYFRKPSRIYGPRNHCSAQPLLYYRSPPSSKSATLELHNGQNACVKGELQIPHKRPYAFKRKWAPNTTPRVIGAWHERRKLSHRYYVKQLIKQIKKNKYLDWNNDHNYYSA